MSLSDASFRVVAELAAETLRGGSAEGVVSATAAALIRAVPAEWSWLMEPTADGARRLLAAAGWPGQAGTVFDEGCPLPNVTSWKEVPMGRRGWLGIGGRAALPDGCDAILRSVAEIACAALDLREVARLSHDYNNQLTNVAVSIELLLEDTPAGDGRRDDLLAVQLAGERAVALTSRLAQLGRR